MVLITARVLMIVFVTKTEAPRTAEVPGPRRKGSPIGAIEA